MTDVSTAVALRTGLTGKEHEGAVWESRNILEVSSILMPLGLHGCRQLSKLVKPFASGLCDFTLYKLHLNKKKKKTKRGRLHDGLGGSCISEKRVTDSFVGLIY